MGKNQNVKRKLKILAALLVGLLSPMGWLAVGAVSGHLELGLSIGCVIGLALYLLIARRELDLHGGLLWVMLGGLCVVAFLSVGNSDFSMAVMLFTYGIIGKTAVSALTALAEQGGAAPTGTRTAQQNSSIEEQTTEHDPWDDVPVQKKKSSKRGLLAFALFLIAIPAGLYLPSVLSRSRSTTPEEVEAIYYDVNRTCTVDQVTFAVDPTWEPVPESDGMFLSQDKQTAYGLNAVTPLGSRTPDEAYQELMAYYQSQYEVYNYPVLSSFNSQDAVKCYTGDIEAQLDNGTYALITAVFVPRKNLMLTLMGQCSDKDSLSSVGGAVRDMMFSLSFQVGDQDFVSGNTFVMEDGSELCLKADGGFYYYQTEDDHSQNYYAGTYEAYYGQAAVDLVVSRPEYGLTEEELEAGLSANMDGYVPGGSSILDLLAALEPELHADSPTRYFVCRDTLYAVLLHNKQLVTTGGETRSIDAATLYLGYYIPELKQVDMLNCNTANQYMWQYKAPTSALEAEPGA